MLPFERIPIGQWLPDRPSYPSPGAAVVKNCVPQADSYRELRELLPATAAAPGGVVGAIWVQVAAIGAVAIVVGTPTDLLLLNGAAWTTLATGFPSVASWEFAYFGDSVIAVAPGVDPQVIDLSAGSPTAVALVGAPANPPRARCAAVVRDFVVLGDLDNDGRVIQWSGFNNATIWDANGSTAYQADSQLLFTGGRVQKIVGGPFGYIFQENEIRSLEYVGPPPVFNIQVLSRERGTPAANSVVSAGDQVFFYAQDGFHALRGKAFLPIGEERVNRWFKGACASDEIANMRSAVDRSNRVVVWTFSSASGQPHDRVLLYNYAVDRWSYAETTLAYIFEARPAGYHLDNIDTALPAGIDIDSIPVESRAYLGGTLTLFGADSTGAIGTFDGAALPAVIETAEFDGGNNQRRSIAGVRPIVHGAAATGVSVEIGRRDQLIDAETFTAPRTLNSIGEAPILSDARYQRVRLTIAGGFTHAGAADVFSRPSGRF